MDSLKDLLDVYKMDTKSIGRALSTHKTNKIYLIAEQIGIVTGTLPNRWLRVVKQHEHACLRALDDLKEIQARNPAALYTWLVKKYQ